MGTNHPVIAHGVPIKGPLTVKGDRSVSIVGHHPLSNDYSTKDGFPGGTSHLFVPRWETIATVEHDLEGPNAGVVVRPRRYSLTYAPIREPNSTLGGTWHERRPPYQERDKGRRTRDRRAGRKIREKVARSGHR